jgi:hypothetical protein
MTTPTLRRRAARVEEAFRTRQVMRAQQQAFDERPLSTWASTVGTIEALIESGRIRVPDPPECAKSHTSDDLCEDCTEWVENIVGSWPTGTP